MFVNQTILLTGATGSLGEKLIYKIIKDKPKRLILLGRNKNILLNLQKTIKSNKILCDLVYFDFLEDNIDSRLEEIFSKYKPEVIIQAAGHLCQQSFSHGDLVEVEKEMIINYLVPIKIINKFISHLDTKSDGTIINILSLSGLVPSPTMLGYSASKSALKHFTEGLRIELAKIKEKRIKICNVTLGLFSSSMTENIQKYRYINSQCPIQIVNSIYTELMSGKEDINVGLYVVGASILNSFAPAVMKIIVDKTSPNISEDGRLL
jgi:3-oxoacyl-[acyl-carrier protein] reductase